MFPLLGLVTPKQIEMITEACQDINRILSLRRLYRLIIRVYKKIRGYPAKRREIRRRRTRRAHMAEYTESYLRFLFDEIERDLMLRPDFLTAYRGALKQTAVAFSVLAPDLDYELWVLGPKSWVDKLTARIEAIDMGLKMIAVFYLSIFGVVAFILGVAFAGPYVAHHIWPHFVHYLHSVVRYLP